jgi:hypothetical protein
MTITIKHRFTNSVLFQSERDSWRAAVEAALKSGADLYGANLYGANLYGAKLSGADLSGANLSGANLSGANLYGAKLSGADLYGANLYGAKLSGANLSGADLYGADLYGAKLSGAKLSGANLSGADLYGANLSGADLYGANLYGANLSGAKNIPPLAERQSSIVPADGPLWGWKKCRDGVLVKVSIGAHAKRSNATGRKCRAEYVKVLEVIGADIGVSTYNAAVVYKLGETVKCDKWDDNRWNECSNGIHFLLTREEAEAYQ